MNSHLMYNELIHTDDPMWSGHDFGAPKMPLATPTPPPEPTGSATGEGVHGYNEPAHPVEGEPYTRTFSKEPYGGELVTTHERVRIPGAHGGARWEGRNVQTRIPGSREEEIGSVSMVNRGGEGYAQTPQEAGKARKMGFTPGEGAYTDPEFANVAGTQEDPLHRMKRQGLNERLVP